MEPGRDPFHAGVWTAALPGGQRQRDPDHDYGLQVHCAAPCVCGVQGVSKACAHGTAPLNRNGSPTHGEGLAYPQHARTSVHLIYEINISTVSVWGHPLVFDKKFNTRV